MVDPGLLRAGRLDIIVDMNLPDFSQRKSLITGFRKRHNCEDISDFDLMRLASATNEYSQAKIESLFQRASLKAIRDKHEKVHFNFNFVINSF